MLNLLIAFLLSLQDPQEPQFPANQGAINDFANILTEEDKTKLRNECAALRDSGGAAVVVVTTPSLYGLDVADYANQLFKKWGIGKKKEDNGVLILIAPNERKARIEVGYGNESRLTDLEAKQILADVVRPLFRAGKVSESVVAGTEAVLKKLGGTTAGPPAETAAPVTVNQAPEDWSGLWIILGVLGLILLVWFLAWSGLGNLLLLGMASSGGGGGGGGGGSWGGGGSSSSDSSSSGSSESSSSGGGDSGGGGASSDL